MATAVHTTVRLSDSTQKEHTQKEHRLILLAGMRENKREVIEDGGLEGHGSRAARWVLC
jgi:hypothetical protein